MMETKLWFALCALLLINLASAEHDNARPTTSAAKTDANTSQVAPGLNSSSQATPTLIVSRTNSSSTNKTADGESTTLTTTAKNDSEANVSRTVNNKTEPSGPSVAGQATTSHPLPTSTLTSHPHAAHTVPVNATTNSTGPTHASNSTSPQPLTNSFSPATNQTEPPRPQTSTSATTSSRSTPGTSTGAPPKQPTTKTQSVNQSTTTQAQTRSTISPAGNSSAPTKANANTPSQLNVAGATTMAHKSPTVDPLLAGLVSAFIITAVVVSLLLFLKLRRRNSRPAFRRLQDLPMDDMEDTPLSMYTY